MTIQNNKIDLEHLETFLKLIEANRDLVYHLHEFNEATKIRLKELEMIKQKAQIVMNLKHNFRNVEKKYKLLLKDDEIKQINNMLQQRHIRI